MSARVQQRTRGSKWMKIRARILRRDPVCVLCAEQDVVRESVVVDHITPLEHGGTDADDNLRGLCADHHDEVTRQQFGYRERKAFGPNGLPIDGSWSRPATPAGGDGRFPAFQNRGNRPSPSLS